MEQIKFIELLDSIEKAELKDSDKSKIYSALLSYLKEIKKSVKV